MTFTYIAAITIPTDVAGVTEETTDANEHEDEELHIPTPVISSPHPADQAALCLPLDVCFFFQ